MAIYVSPSFDKSVRPYFKIYNNVYSVYATACCRISCIEPKYIIVNDCKAKHFNLKREDIDWIMDVLSYKNRWLDMINDYYYIRSNHGYDHPIYQLPDYYKLLDDIHPDYLSIFNKKKRR